MYKAATSVTRSFTVTKAAQSITFAKPATQNLLASPLTVTATSSSGLTVALSSSTTTVCTVTGFDITLNLAGTCKITASQPGTSVYAAAGSITRSFNVTKAPQTITIADPGPQSMLVPKILISAWASSDLPVTLSSSSTGICTIAGDLVTLKKAGTCKIKGVQAGNATYAAATAVTRQFTVTTSTPLPFVTASGATLTVGGTPFIFNGAGTYHTSNHGAPNDPARIVAMAADGGLNTLRFVNMFVEDGLDANAPYLESDWAPHRQPARTRPRRRHARRAGSLGLPQPPRAPRYPRPWLGSELRGRQR